MDFKHNPSTDFKDPDDITKNEAEEEIEALRDGIEYHNHKYYVENDPEISDSTFDTLFERLETLEETFPELQSDNSPTRKVGAPPLDSLPKKQHAAPMLSLNAAHEEKEVAGFLKTVDKAADGNVTYMLEPKFDGFSVEVVYDHGEFAYAATRGDGTTGEDISDNARTIGSLPLRLRQREDAPEFISLRGEVFFPKEPFRDINRTRMENGREPFANPRNAAAGIIRQLDPRHVAEMPLDIVFYEIISISGNGGDGGFKSHEDMFKQLAGWGLKIDSHNRTASSLDEIRDYHSGMEDRREELPYQVDGIVAKVNDYSLRESLGVRQRSPRWAIAWKFPPKKEVTLLNDIVVQVGRTGKLTPVALLDPVDVGGVTISRATLHNAGEVERKDIRPGDRVRVERAGDVIPQVAERIKTPGKKRSSPFSMPGTCPSCGTKVYQEGAYHFCPAELSCPAQLIGHIGHYASRAALDIRELGEKTVTQLVEREMVEDLADIYHLTVEDLETLDGFARKSAKKLHDNIQSAKQPALDRFLYALGIRHIGEHAAGLIARHFHTLDTVMDATVEDVREIGEIGPETADSFVRFFKSGKNTGVLKKLREAGVTPQEVKEEDRGGPLDGMTIVFTGELENFTRSEAESAVEALGAHATSSVSSNTDIVVAGTDPGQKRDDADKHDNIRIMDGDEFRRLLDNPEDYTS